MENFSEPAPEIDPEPEPRPGADGAESYDSAPDLGAKPEPAGWETETVPPTVAVASENFYDAVEASSFYVRSCL